MKPVLLVVQEFIRLDLRALDELLSRDAVGAIVDEEVGAFRERWISSPASNQRRVTDFRHGKRLGYRDQLKSTIKRVRSCIVYVGELNYASWRDHYGSTFITLESDGLFDDLAKLIKHRLFVGAVATAIDKGGRTADVALVLFGLLNDLCVTCAFPHDLDPQLHGELPELRVQTQLLNR